MADINITLGSGIGPQGPVGPSGTGVVSVNTYTGAITIVGAGGATVSAATGVSGATLTITAGSGGGGSGAVDSVNSLTGTVVLSSVSVSAASAVHTHDALNIVSGTFDRDRLPFATDKAVGVVQASAGLTVTAQGHLSADVRSVNGSTGVVSLNSVSVSAASAVHSHSTADITSFAAAAAAAAPVQSVNGLSGAVSLNAVSVTAAGTAVVTKLEGLTGAISISGVNITVASAGTVLTLTGSAGGGGGNVASVAGATGTVTITPIGLSTSQSGSAITLDARPIRVTPTTVTSQQDNWNLGAGDIFRIDNRTTGNLNITGFATSSMASEVLIYNASTHTAATFTIKHQHTASTAVNRVISGWGGDVVLASGGTAGHGAVVLFRDTTDDRWRTA